MNSPRFEFGDRVRHAGSPEWGIGSVVKVENVGTNGFQRLSIRFPGQRIKILNTEVARLEKATEDPAAGVEPGAVPEVTVWDRIGEDGWLAGVAQKKILETMVRLPEEARDPFRSVRQRLASTLGLYRFERTGRSLVEWAVAQTGLDDPLSRFNRHELEVFFDRWASEREAHLHRLLQEPEADRTLLNELIADAPAPAKRAVRQRQPVR